MSIDAQELKGLIEGELEQLSDQRVVAFIKKLLVEPTVTMRRWDYGNDDEHYPVWTVLRHSASNTGIGYCEHGHGPDSPWGLLHLEGDESGMSIGEDFAWFSTFLIAFFDSKASTELPIWRIFKGVGTTGQWLAITDEGEWDETWAKMKALRETNTSERYDCRTSIQYRRE